jgi:hypothetical protein
VCTSSSFLTWVVQLISIFSPVLMCAWQQMGQILHLCKVWKRSLRVPFYNCVNLIVVCLLFVTDKFLSTSLVITLCIASLHHLFFKCDKEKTDRIWLCAVWYDAKPLALYVWTVNTALLNIPFQ